MKKMIAIALLIALVISCCACGKKEVKEEPVDLYAVDLEQLMADYQAEKKEGEATPEQMYGMIDEMTPIDGVYKIWSAKGVQNMADHPDADFEFLCSIDMKGATLRPIGSKDKPFTGSIMGQNTILSNFTISESNGGYMGFIGYNQGSVTDIKLEGVTMVADANTKYIGGMAGYSEKALRSVTVNGTMLVENAAEGAVCGAIAGYTSGDVINCASDMDITYTAAGAATIGGFVGVAEGIRGEFTENYGALVISGSNKTVGLMAGEAKNVDLYNIAFLGEKNEIDGKLCTEYFGKVENEKYEKLLVRDNTPYIMDENVAKLRDTVVARMYEMATIRWTVSQDTYYDCNCLLSSCHGQYKAGMVHVGLPYKHYSSNYRRFLSALDEDHVLKDWVYEMPGLEGYEIYLGNDCLGSTQSAWWAVSNSSNVYSCIEAQPVRGTTGVIAVGDWPSDINVPNENADSKDWLIPKADINVWYDAFSKVRRGDAYMHLAVAGHHIRMAQEDPVVVRDENGMIDGDYSYIITIEQGAPTQLEPYYCSWRYDYKYSFKNLILAGYYPITIEELLTGEMEPVECKLVGGAEGRSGMTAGTVETNYNIDYVTLQIKDSEGNTAFEHTMIPNAGYYSDFNNYTTGIRNISLKFDLGRFATPLRDAKLARGESYTYNVTVQTTPGDAFVVTEGSFTNGNAA